ncbi:MAG: branched-chain amino acid transaminase [Alphaproteobacteria bacterium]|nr:branched-chain amino acid transaminase [Alphaproteobacteria bacterium]MCY4608395.1 branched-chain amino acid transaminase [bacterium]
MSTEPLIVLNGDLVPYGQATAHVMSPAMRYGLNVFEGLRAYWNAGENELHVFRLQDHLGRLAQSMKLLRFAPTFNVAELGPQLLDLLRANEIKDACHIRMSAYLDGDGEHHVSGPVSYFIASRVQPRSEKAVTGIRCAVSSWVRMADSAMPPRIKCGANYVNARLARFQALHDGYDDALLLNEHGKVGEGPGACVFLVRHGQLVTPDITSGILESITRDTMMALARDVGINVVERTVDRTELYAANEMFVAGSAAEVLPVVSVDGIELGDGRVGPATKALQAAYFSAVTGDSHRDKGWLTPVYGSA